MRRAKPYFLNGIVNVTYTIPIVLVSLLALGCGSSGSGGSGAPGGGGSSAIAMVSGIVTDAGSGQSVSNARVTLFNSNLTFFREVRADAQGAYAFAGVPIGSYQLGVAARDREYEETTVSLASGTTTRSFALAPETQAGRWTVVASALQYLDGTGSGSLTPDGKVFFCHDTRDPDLFDPRTNTTRAGRDSLGEQGCHIVTTNTDGLLFFAGGSMGGDPQDPVSRAAKTYDSRTDVWSAGPADMSTGRWYPMIVRLPDERLLVLGGELDGTPTRTATCEIYDPATDRWTPTGSMGLPTEIAPAVLLYTGEVLRSWRFPELYNLTTGAWRAAATMQQPRVGAAQGDHCDHTIVLLDDGRVMALGIIPFANNATPSFTEFYDPGTNTWSRGPNPRHLSSRPEALVLPDGRVLSFGGQYTGAGTVATPPARGNAGALPDCTKVTDLYDPAADRWRALADMNRFIHYHNVSVLVPDGRVIATGGAGGNSRVFGDDPRIEAFEPPYLFRGVRPKIDSISSNALVVGGTVTLQVSRTEAVSEVVLVGANNSTHWADGGPQRRLSLAFTQTGAQVQATVPNDPVRALPGYYLLMVLVDDIPSEAEVVSLRKR